MADLANISHKAFFGDHNHVFALGRLQVAELERLCGSGIGAICNRVFRMQFSQAEVFNTIRLGLVGGGLSPEIAERLIETYAAPYPLEATYPLAVGTLEALWFGAKKGETNEPA
jgi:hypothetical protein